jgi:hypothetical protein
MGKLTNSMQKEAIIKYYGKELSGSRKCWEILE